MRLYAVQVANAEGVEISHPDQSPNSRELENRSSALWPRGDVPFATGVAHRYALVLTVRIQQSLQKSLHCCKNRPQDVCKLLAPQVGLEPTTLRLTAECSTIELLRNNTNFKTPMFRFNQTLLPSVNPSSFSLVFALFRCFSLSFALSSSFVADSGRNGALIPTGSGAQFRRELGHFRPSVVMVPHLFRNGAPPDS